MRGATISKLVFQDNKLLEHILSFIEGHKDRNSISLVCKSWYDTERVTRKKVFVGNCYAVSPSTVTRRFPNVEFLEMKGKPHFADFNLIPDGWGGYFQPWVQELVKAYPSTLKDIRLKRMVVTDDCLEIVAKKLEGFEVLVLRLCEGFSTDGLSAIASSCRNLKMLDLRDCEIDVWSGDWLSHFPEDYTSLESLNITSLNTEVNFQALESLVSRCPNLRSLHLNRLMPLKSWVTLLSKAPAGLLEFGTGTYSSSGSDEEECQGMMLNLSKAFLRCKEIKSLSGFWDVVPAFLDALYPICSKLEFLNLSYALLPSSDLIKLIKQCPNLRRLWVLDSIEDSGLEALATHCKNLQELRVFPSDDPSDAEEPAVTLTEKGLVSVSEGCPNLKSVLYFCRQMTNDALKTIAKNSPQLTHFRLCIMEPHTPDYITSEPLDAGFGAIVEHCKNLHRLSLSGLLSDRVFEYIGKHAKRLEMLSVAFAGDTDLGLHHVLSGCERLKKLEIRDSPFGNKTALLDNASKLETMRSLWLSSCLVSYGTCKLLRQKMPRVNIEVIDENESLDLSNDVGIVDKVYIYRTLAGPRSDMPEFVRTMENGN